MSEQSHPHIEVSYLFRNEQQQFAPLFAEATNQYVATRPEAEDAGMYVEEVKGRDEVTHVVLGRRVLEPLSRGEVHREAEVMQDSVDAIIHTYPVTEGFSKQFHAGHVLKWLSEDGDLD